MLAKWASPPPTPVDPMSKRVLFVSLALCLTGLLAGWDILRSAIAGGLRPNFGVLFLPIGCGLLLGSQLARTAASGLFILSYLVGAWMVLAPLFVTASAAVVSDSRDVSWMSGYPILLVGVLIVVAVLALLHWLLYSPPFDEHLSEGKP